MDKTLTEDVYSQHAVCRIETISVGLDLFDLCVGIYLSSTRSIAGHVRVMAQDL
jgi:hypothetical protein